MRFKAMFTVESSYLIPLFTIITVLLLQILLFFHDRTICNSVIVKTNMRVEFENLDENGMEEAKRAANEYLDERLVLGLDEIEFRENMLIKENNMSKFVRLTKALIGKKEEDND